MRVLGVHSDGFRFEARERASAAAEAVEEDARRGGIDGECIVLFIAVEKPDEAGPDSVAAQLAADTLERADALGCKRAVVYPYVHLTDEPSRPRVALQVLEDVHARLTAGGIDVLRAPFGWYKSFEVECLGHPLAEWSGRYGPGAEQAERTPAEAKGRKPSEFVRFVVADLDGECLEVTPDDFGGCPAFGRPEPIYGLLHQFVANELTGGVDLERPPEHIAYMRRHELVDYCDVSEKGHLKWYPKGVLMRQLIVDYAAALARDWGAVEMKNPLVIRGDHNVVGELMGEFHERDYQVDGGRGICYLRYASDPLAFPFMQHVQFSHRQTPLRVYEEALCFRNEQEGEVSGLKRTRAFTMTDMHAACATVEQARAEFEDLCVRFAGLVNDLIAGDRWVLGWEGTVDFFEQNRDWLVGIGRRIGVPAFFKLMPQMSHYYAMKNEFQSITEDLSNIQLSTVQWDVKDGERFDIGFTDETGRKHPCPVILHASSFGSIERTLCAILENIAVDARAGRPPCFPFWLAPTQARVVPVSQEHVDFAVQLCDTLSGGGLRVDVDDRNETVGKKIRNGEREWVPYLLVVGQKERESGELTVRSREDGGQQAMPLDAFAQMAAARAEGMPFRPLPLPKLLSQRPIFVG